MSAALELGSRVANVTQAAIERVLRARSDIAAVDIRIFEDGDAAQAKDVLVPHVVQQVDSVIGLVGDLRGGEDETTLDLAVGMVMTECMALRDRLDLPLEAHSTWAVIASCAELLGRAARLIDLTLAMITGGGSADLQHRDDLGRALRIRRLYARLTSAMLGETPAAQPELTRRLRIVGTVIATIAGSATFAELWPRDRLTLRASQQRIIEWLRAPNLAEGRWLWTD